MIRPSQISLPDHKQRSQEKNIHVPGGIEPAIPAIELPQTHVLDGAATGIGTRDSYFYIKLLAILVVRTNGVCFPGKFSDFRRGVDNGFLCHPFCSVVSTGNSFLNHDVYRDTSEYKNSLRFTSTVLTNLIRVTLKPWHSISPPHSVEFIGGWSPWAGSTGRSGW